MPDTICESPLRVHRDGSMSCERPDCPDARSASEIERAVVRHRVRLSCDDPRFARCPRCQPA